MYILHKHGIYHKDVAAAGANATRKMTLLASS